MKHNYITDDVNGDHWAVSRDGNGNVLVQVQEEGLQARVAITPQIARQFAELLIVMAYKSDIDATALSFKKHDE